MVTRCSGQTPREDANDGSEASETPQSGDPSAGETRECDHCGEDFDPYRDWQRFCPGGSCRKAYHRERRIEAAKEDVVEHVMAEVREAVVEAVERAFDNLSL